MNGLMEYTPICNVDDNGNPILSEREKRMEATAEEIVQLLRKHNLTVGEARSVLNSVGCAISQSVEEMPVGINAGAIEKMQTKCRRVEKRRQRTRRLLAAISKLNKRNEAKNQGFELPYRS